MQAGKNHKFVYIDEERTLLADVKELASLAGHRFTRTAEEAVLSFARRYGLPSMPDATTSGYRLSLATIREELIRFRNFERRQVRVRDAVARLNDDALVPDKTWHDCGRLGEEVTRYLDSHRVRVIFEVSESLALTPRLFSGDPITSAVVRLVTSWASESGLAPQLCECGCGDVFTPRRRNHRYINSSHRQQGSRNRA